MTMIKRKTIEQIAITLSSFANSITVRSVSGNHNLALIDGLPISVELKVDHDKDDYVVRGYLVGQLIYSKIGYFGAKHKEHDPETIDSAFAKIVDKMWFTSFQESEDYPTISSALRLGRECHDIRVPARLTVTANASNLICRSADGVVLYNEKRTFSKDLTQLVPLREAITNYLTTNNFSKFNF